MQGLISMLPHIITVILIYLAILIIAQIVKRSMLKSIGVVKGMKGFIKKRGISRIVSLVNIWATGAMVVVVVLIVLFLSNPFERSHVPTIAEAAIDESFQEPTKAKIATSNKEVIKKKHLEKEQEAETDNAAAMKEAANLFNTK